MFDAKEIEKHFSEESEMGLLGSMILDTRIIPPILEWFNGQDFYLPRHREVFTSILNCRANCDGDMDLVLLHDDLKSRGKLEMIGGSQYLVDLKMSAATSGHAEKYAQIIIDHARLRNHFAALYAGQRELNSDGPIEDRLQRCELALADRHKLASTPKGVRDIELITMDRIAPIEIAWLWPNVIPMGSITMLVGQPGQGKSFVCMDIAARVTTGRSWPDAPQMPTAVGSVLIFAFEDDLSRTIRPRLDACGADCTKIRAFESIRTTVGRSETIDLPSHLPQLEQAVRDIPDLRLIVFDPITSCLGGTDQNSQAEVRAALMPLQNFAQRTGVAILGVSHFGKRTDTNAMHRILGSVSFAAVSRSIWCVHREPVTVDTPHPRRLFLPLKNNYAIEPTGRAFDIVGGAVEWGLLPVTGDTDEILGNRPDKSYGSKKLRDAKTFLRELLEGKESVESEEIFRRAREYQISDTRLREAKKELSVDAFKSSFSGKWMWAWPDQTMLDKVSA